MDDCFVPFYTEITMNGYEEIYMAHTIRGGTDIDENEKLIKKSVCTRPYQQF